MELIRLSSNQKSFKIWHSKKEAEKWAMEFCLFKWVVYEIMQAIKQEGL